MSTTPERSGWRDESISRRHREWGVSCRCVDLDWIVCEYNHGLPVALIEYKEKSAVPINLDNPNYKPILSLAENYRPGPIPFVIAIYDKQDFWVIPIPMNEAARLVYSHCIGEILTEVRWVRSLQYMRKDALTKDDENALLTLKTITPKHPPKMICNGGHFGRSNSADTSDG